MTLLLTILALWFALNIACVIALTLTAARADREAIGEGLRSNVVHLAGYRSARTAFRSTVQTSASRQ